MKTKFWKIYAIITGIGLVICAAVLILLWTFLASYEKAQPEHTAQDAVSMFKNLDVDSIVSHYNNRSAFVDSDDVIREAVRKHIQGNEYTYSKKMVKYTSDNPAYSIKADGKEVAVVTLAKSGEKGMFNSDIWLIADIDLGFSTESYHYVVAPSDYTVRVNGVAISEDSIVERDINSSEFENVSKYTDVPLLVKYKIDGAYISPDITCTGAVSGSELTPEINGATYTYSYETDSSAIDSSSDNIKKFITNYTKYMYTEADFSSISGSVIANSKAYDFLRYVTYTSVWYADHSSLTIGDISLTNIKRYSADCYSVEADYTYDVVMSGTNYNYPTKITLYYVNYNGNWKIADLKTT